MFTPEVQREPGQKNDLVCHYENGHGFGKNCKMGVNDTLNRNVSLWFTSPSNSFADTPLLKLHLLTNFTLGYQITYPDHTIHT